MTASNQVVHFPHGLGVVPTQCLAYWSTSSTGTNKRLLPTFNNTCYANGLNPGWQGADLSMDATNVNLPAYSGGNLFCYYDPPAGWSGSNTAYVQIVCDK